VSQVVERDDGYTQVEDVGPYLAPPRRWIACERALLPRAHGRVLDVGTGAGRVALALQERGHDVVAIDISEGAIDVCSDRGVRDVRLRAASSIRAADGPFDTFVLFGNNLGLLRDARHAVWLLRRLRTAGSPTSRILGSGRDPHRTNEPHHVAYHARNRARDRLPGQMRFRLRYLEHRTRWFDYLFPSPAELRSLAASGGWSLTEVVEDDEGRYSALLIPTH
jgi:SAM-dependent methyltransferase